MAKPVRSSAVSIVQAVVLALTVALMGCAPRPPAPAPQRPTKASAESALLQQLQIEILRRVNHERVATGMGELMADPDLGRVAELYSAELATRGNINHFSDTPFRHTLRERLSAERVTYTAAGENLARMSAGIDVGERCVRSWQRSPGHNRNMLDGRYARSGVGVTHAADGYFYIVQIYATPL